MLLFLLFLTLLNFLVLVVCVLLAVAFFTLFERSGLGYIQIRKGPVKVGYGGIFQPFADAIKLLVSEVEQPMSSNFFPYFLCPILSLFLFLIVWTVIPFSGGGGQLSYSLLFFLCVIGVGVYTVMGSGWFSNSKYALFGCLRFVAQTISYEVSLAMVVISLSLVVGSYLMYDFFWGQMGGWFIVFCLPMGVCWIVIMLAESNRTPFDFAEGESELVSGFNVEYGGGGFALLFMAEYASILMMSFFFCAMFLGGVSDYVSFYVVLVVFFFIWVRGLLPRLRYDMLMYLAWKDILPLTLNYFIFLVGIYSLGLI